MSRCDHLPCVALPGLLDRGQLQVFLGAEVCEQAALAHGQLGGQPPDAKAVQAVDGGQVGGGPQDGLLVLAPWLVLRLDMHPCIARTVVLV